MSVNWVDTTTVDGVDYDLRDSGSVRYDESQSLTDAQKETARGNVGAASVGEVDDLKSAIKLYASTEIIIGKNIFNNEFYSTDGKFDGNGSFSTATGFKVTNPIWLKAGTYAYNLRYNSYSDAAKTVVVSDSAGTKLDKLTATRTENTIKISGTTYDWFTFVLTNDNYIRLNAGASSGQSLAFMICRISALTDLPGTYITYDGKEKLNDDVRLNSSITGYVDKQNITHNIIGENIFNGDAFDTQGYINSNGFTAGSGYYTSEAIFLPEGTYAYAIRAASYGAAAEYYAICNESGVISSAEKATDTEETITIGTTTLNWYSLNVNQEGYFRFNIGVGTSQADIFMLTKISTIADLPTTYKSYHPLKTMDDEIYPNNIILRMINNPLAGKKISVNGDSICEGVGYAGGYGKIIAENNGMAYQNIGVGGGCVAYYLNKYCISRGVETMASDADYAIVEGGVNDAANQVPLGAITNDFYSSNVYDDTTFYGAMESMFKKLTTRFAGKKIGYIIPHQCSGRFKPGESYYNAAMECCKKWGIPVLDLSVQCPPFGFFRENTPMEALKNTYTKDGDGWHPNEQGYKLYYIDKITAWLKSL